jgi:hypothetical protein
MRDMSMEPGVDPKDTVKRNVIGVMILYAVVAVFLYFFFTLLQPDY